MHVFFKLPRPIDQPIEVDAPLLPILYVYLSFRFPLWLIHCSYRNPAGPPGGTYIRERPKGSTLQLIQYIAAHIFV